MMNAILLVLTEIVSRLVFVAHGFISIALLFCYHRDNHAGFWLLFLPQFGLISEFVLTMWKRKSMQFRFFWPSGFFYVLTMIPIICINELEENKVIWHNLTNGITDVDVKINKTTTLSPATTKFSKPPVYTVGNDVRICQTISKHSFIKQICELGMFLCIIIGRWMIPRGQITRDQLSALLLGFVGTTADILEIFELFKEDKIKDSHDIIIVVILMFTVATLQFTLVTTATSDDSESFKDIFKRKKVSNKVSPEDEKTLSNNGLTTQANDVEKQTYIERIQKQKKLKTKQRAQQRGRGKKNIPNMARRIADAEAARKVKLKEEKRQMHTELFQIMVTMVMQDGPFLILRVYIILYYNIYSEMHVFFTCKNFLVVLLLVYRLLILNCEGVDKDDDWRDENMKIKIQHIHFPSQDQLRGDPVNGSKVIIM